MTTNWQPIETAPRHEDIEILMLDKPSGERWIVSWRSFPPGSYAPGAWKIKKPPGRDPILNFSGTHWAFMPDRFDPRRD